MKTLVSVSLTIAALATTLNSSAATQPRFDQAKICRATIAALMGRNPKIIKVDKEDAGIVHVSYIRPDDGTLWEQRCRLEGARVLWATRSGRWRDDPRDETVTYSVNGQTLSITTKYTDGSGSTKTYTAAQLGSK